MNYHHEVTMAHCPNCGALIKYGQSYCNVCDRLTGWEEKMEKPEIIEMWAIKEKMAIGMYGKSDGQFKGCLSYGILDKMIEGQNCRVVLIIWPPEEDENGTD